MLTAGRAFEVASAVLTAVEDHYGNEGVGLPARRYVADGPVVVHDCEQIAVAVERIFMGSVAQQVLEPVTCYHERVAVIAVHTIRCSPPPKVVGQKATPPSPSAISESAAMTLADAVLVENALLEAHREARLGQVSGLAFEDWNGIGPGGNLVGGILRVRVGLAPDLLAAGS